MTRPGKALLQAQAIYGTDIESMRARLAAIEVAKEALIGQIKPLEAALVRGARERELLLDLVASVQLAAVPGGEVDWPLLLRVDGDGSLVMLRALDSELARRGPFISHGHDPRTGQRRIAIMLGDDQGAVAKTLELVRTLQPHLLTEQEGHARYMVFLPSADTDCDDSHYILVDKNEGVMLDTWHHGRHYGSRNLGGLEEAIAGLASHGAQFGLANPDENSRAASI